MTTQTNTEIVTATLRKLEVLAQGDTLNSEDSATATAVLESRVEFLRARGIAWWTDDAVPLEAAEPLAEYLTFWMAREFSVPEDYSGRMRLGFADLSELSSLADDSGEPIAVDYF